MSKLILTPELFSNHCTILPSVHQTGAKILIYLEIKTLVILFILCVYKNIKKKKKKRCFSKHTFLEQGIFGTITEIFKEIKIVITTSTSYSERSIENFDISWIFPMLFLLERKSMIISLF